VLGASITNIFKIVSSEFMKLVILSNIIAWPVAYYLMNKWLQGFAYRIDIGLWVFIVSGMIALVISIVTVGFQSVKAAIENPIKS
jgi:putative ABC transport system permease protein